MQMNERNDSIENYFVQDGENFTIFVVEQAFAIGRGHSYFKRFFNTQNFLDTDKKISIATLKTAMSISQNIPILKNLVSIFAKGVSYLPVDIAVTTLCKMYTVHEHQSVGVNVIDPIILQEGRISSNKIAELVAQNKNSILRPAIIIILKDNNFDRAKNLLSLCPHGLNVRMIRNNGEQNTAKIINCGAENVEAFLSAFGDQCFSTCSNTKKEILYNEAWKNNDYANRFTPILLRARSNLLIDNKKEAKLDLIHLKNELGQLHAVSENDQKILNTLKCMVSLFTVFCNDAGGEDIKLVMNLSKELENEIIKAHLYRFAEFIPNTTRDERAYLYNESYEIFCKNKMLDHAIYCKNNMLVEQFYSNEVNPETFRELHENALSTVPGMVGMSHIYNNVGLAYLYSGNSDLAIEYFLKGQDYAFFQDRIIQNVALQSNAMIAKSYSFCDVDNTEIHKLLRKIFDGIGTEKLAFLTSDYVLNILTVAAKQDDKFAKDLVHDYPIIELINNGFNQNNMGSGERVLQMQYMDKNFKNNIIPFNELKIPKKLTVPKGKKKDFIERYGINLFEFNTWL